MSLGEDLKYYGIEQLEICSKLGYRQDTVSRAVSESTEQIRAYAHKLIVEKKERTFRPQTYRTEILR